MFVNRKKSPFCLTPKHGASGGVLRHPPLCSVFTVLFLSILILFQHTNVSAATYTYDFNGPQALASIQYASGTEKDSSVVFGPEKIFLIAQDGSNYYLISGEADGVSYSTSTGKIGFYNAFYRAHVYAKGQNWPNTVVDLGTYNNNKVYDQVHFFNTISSNFYIKVDGQTINIPPPATPTPTNTPYQDFLNNNKFGNNEEHGLKGWLKDLWSFLTDPEDYGTIQVGDGDTLVYSTPTPQPTPTPYIRHQNVIDPSTGEVIYNVETTIQNETTQLYPTDYVWLDDVPDTVPHEFDLNFSVSGTPTEYTTDLNFSETGDAFVETVSGVQDGINALGSLLGAMPIEILIYPIVAFCIWAIFAFIHRLLG